MSTYVKIETITVGAGGAASIDFTSIPATYTDLALLSSLRSSDGGVAVDINIKFNNVDTGKTILYADATGSGTRSGFYSYTSLGCNGSSATSNTFANSSLYIANYADTSNNKRFSIDYAPETNATTTYYGFKAGEWASTAAVNRLTFVGNFVQYSTATLYGIKKNQGDKMGTVIEKNCTTGEEIIREETPEEIADREAAAEAWLEQKRIEEQEAADRAVAKAALLERLGITEDEAKLLLA